jgi:glycine/D-amino acid oxidase-like deaminating enzyme
MDTFLATGGRIEVREFASREEIAALPEGTVFNCTGLGAKALFGDDEMMPAKGQLVFLLPQPEVDYNVLADGRYMFPRSDGILLGGSFERGNWDTTPDPAVTARILERNAAVMARLKPA